jgi:universal stress protein A
MTIKRILFCTDFSRNSLPARQQAAEFAAVFGAELFILHVVTTRPPYYPPVTSEPDKEISKILQKIDEWVREEMALVAEVCRAGVPAVKTFLRAGDPATEIVRFADKFEVDLIVVGTHGWTRIRHLILGSTAEKVARRATKPLLVVRAAVPCQAGSEGPSDKPEKDFPPPPVSGVV